MISFLIRKHLLHFTLSAGDRASEHGIEETTMTAEPVNANQNLERREERQYLFETTGSVKAKHGRAEHDRAGHESIGQERLIAVAMGLAEPRCKISYCLGSSPHHSQADQLE